MKIVNFSEALMHKNGENCIAYEYEFDSEKGINGAIIELTGRYPESGQAVNDNCKEQAYVIEGNGAIYQSGQKYELSTGDMVLIQPGEQYYFDGALKMLIASSPAWYVEQHHNIQ